MIKVEAKNGSLNISAKGSNAELFADACVLVKGVYSSLKEEIKDENVAEEFKKACTSGSLFEEDDDKCKLGILKQMLEELMGMLDKEEDESDE